MSRTREQFEGAGAYLPSSLSLPVLAEAAGGCRGCDLYKTGTQTVFGEGRGDAVAMLVGEQPGDVEDRTGRPFVGPAGKLLDECLREAGIDRGELYITNAVKHFKWEKRGGRRIHVKPTMREVMACRGWLEAEIAVVRPRMIVCLGATAAQSLLGAEFRVTEDRGKVLQTQWAPWLMATVHPSSLLRIPDAAMREAATERFVGELKGVGGEMRKVARSR